MAEHAGPFGLYMGQPASDFNLSPYPEGVGHYKLNTVPHPHPLFAAYYGRFIDPFGLSRVFADTDAMDTDCEGLKIRHEFFEMQNRLINKYGEPELLNFRTDFEVDHDGLPMDPVEEPSQWMQNSMTLSVCSAPIGIICRNTSMEALNLWDLSFAPPLPKAHFFVLTTL